MGKSALKRSKKIKKSDKAGVKYMLIKLEKCLVFQVLSMPETFRDDLEFVKGGDKLYSRSCTEIAWDGDLALYLRGSDESKDLEPSTVEFETNVERDICYVRVHHLLMAWADSLREDTPTVIEGQTVFEV